MIRRFQRWQKRAAQRWQSFARAFKGFRFPASGSGYGLGGIGSGSFHTLPGAEYDYRKNAGNLWENGVVLTIIKWVGRNFHEARQVVERPGKDDKPEVVYDHPILDLLEQPSDDFDRTVLEAGYLLSLAVDGNAYLVKVYSELGKVVGLHYVPHFMMRPYWPKDGSAFITGYVYRVEGGTYLFPKEQVVHLRDGIDPTNERLGLSSFSGVLREICTDNEGATMSAALLRNCGVPTVVFSPKDLAVEALNSDQIEKFKRDYLETTRGEGAGEPFVNGIPVDMHVPGFSPEQLVLDKIRSIPVERICAAFGIDPMAVALPSTNKTYSNYTAAKTAAYDGCIKPLQRVIDSQMTRQLMGDMLTSLGRTVTARDRLARDYTGVEALAEDQDKLHERWRLDYASGAIKRSTFLKRIGEPFDASDDVYLTDIKTAQVQIMADAKAEPAPSASA